ncbi:MAG TPA: TIGR03618 family F420-dependent PPOX class oxidoreductase [Chloroflexota bacterium]|nr:TIGR03618 family F420-dependent PPOX class oxidoreductase [Chloroflexota bacterium]
MRKNLSPEDLGDFLEQAKNAVLATQYADGTVLLSPVWYEWREGAFEIVIGANDVKARHLRRDPRASAVVAEDVPPYRGLEVRGVATVRPAADAGIMRRVARRYLGVEAGDRYTDQMDSADQVVIRIAPGHLRAWDFADEF